VAVRAPKIGTPESQNRSCNNVGGRDHPATAISEKRPGSCKALFAQLSNYLDEQLDDSLCEKLEQHLDGCEPCKAFLASLESTIEQLRNSPSDSFNKVAAAKLRRELLARMPSSLV